jgi:hypothetical protein
MEIYLWICLILFFAAFTQGVAGFGSALTALPLLAIFLDIKTAIPLVGLFSLSVTTLLLVQLLKYLEWKKIYSLIVGAIAGIPIGVFFLKRLDKDTIQWTLGIFLIVYSIYSLSYKLSKNGMREGWAYFYGFLGGCLGGALSTPGPPVVVYTSLQCDGCFCPGRQWSDYRYRPKILCVFPARVDFGNVWWLVFLRKDKRGVVQKDHVNASRLLGGVYALQGDVKSNKGPGNDNRKAYLFLGFSS